MEQILNDLKKIIESVNIKKPLIKKDFPLLGLYTSEAIIILGIIDENGKSIHLRTWRELLKTIGFFENTIEEVETVLREERWLDQCKNKKGWLELSNAGKKYYQYFKNEILIKNYNIPRFIVNTYDEIDKRISNDSSPISKSLLLTLHKKTIERGTDLLLYLSDGDKDRTLWGINELIRKRKRLYGNVYICLPKEGVDTDILENIIKNKNQICRSNIIQIKDTWWKNDFKELIRIVSYPRERLDIITVGFPRISLFLLDLSLRKNGLNYYAYYIRAHKYPYENGQITNTEVINYTGNRNINTNKIAIFGENSTIRFQNEKLNDYLSASTSLQIYLPRNTIDFGPNKHDLELDREVEEVTLNFWNKLDYNYENPIYIDYRSSDEICNKLFFYGPNVINVGGSRSVVIGISQYIHKCIIENNPNLPILLFPHILSTKYAEGILPKLFSINRKDDY